MREIGRCEHCSHLYPASFLTGLEVQGKVYYQQLCPGCFYCWEHTPPNTQEPDPTLDEMRQTTSGLDAASRWMNGQP